MINLRHILRFGVLSIMLGGWPVCICANEAEMDGLHCGDVVVISATPQRNYEFVSWSDGNTDNPREIEIYEAMEIYAIFEPICVADEVPVVWLYNQLMMVNVDSLQRMGYSFSEQSVHWYRIVGDMDAESGTTDDQLIADGYYYNLLPNQTGGFYAAVDVGMAEDRCSDVLYSHVIQVGNTDLDMLTEDEDKGIKKIIIDNQLYILVDDRIYRADGSRLK